MRVDKITQKQIYELEAKIERAVNRSSGSIEDESRIDDLYCELLQIEETIAQRL